MPQVPDSLDERGSVAMIFALSLVVVVMMVGLAVDIAGALHTKTRISSALDAAALAAAKSLHEKDLGAADITTLARRFFDVNLGDAGPNFGQVSDFEVAVDKANSTVSITATANVPMAFARVGGIDNISFPTTAAAAFDPKDIEVALSLDVTGSMCNPCTKIEDLQVAASDLVSILLPEQKSSTNKVRVALAPFGAGVNAGDAFASLATNKRAADTCVFERDGADRSTDAAPGAGAYLKIAGDSGVAGSPNNCPSGAKVTALTDRAGTLNDAIGGLRAGGSTAGHLGTAWAWYLVSPQWASVWPADSRPAAAGPAIAAAATPRPKHASRRTRPGPCAAT